MGNVMITQRCIHWWISYFEIINYIYINENLMRTINKFYDKF